MVKSIKKRDGRLVPYEKKKNADAIFKSAKANGGNDYKLFKNRHKTSWIA